MATQTWVIVRDFYTFTLVRCLRKDNKNTMRET